jgi:PKD repeat protein
MDKNQDYATFGMNLSTGALNVLFTNTTVAFPNYSMDDKTIAFASYNMTPFTGYVALGADKISIAGQGVGIATYATFPIFYGTGTRQLGLKPAAAFSADVRSGKAPLEVQYMDLSDNKPNRWSWEFEGGTPVVAVTQNPVVYYHNPGVYKVKLTVYNDYGNDVIEKQSYITVGATGIESASQAPIRIYPNPASDFIWVQGAGYRVQDVKLLDITGKIIPVSFYNDNEGIRVDVSGLSQGIYLLQTTLPEGRTASQRFVKK